MHISNAHTQIIGHQRIVKTLTENKFFKKKMNLTEKRACSVMKYEQCFNDDCVSAIILMM